MMKKLFTTLIILSIPAVLISQTLNNTKSNTKINQTYSLDLVTDLIISPIGISTLTIGLIVYDLPKPTQAKVNALRISDINPIDRFSANFWNPAAATTSDIFLYVSVAIPYALMLFPKVRNEWLTILAMYGETMSISLGFNLMSKGLVQRFRPYAYNSMLSIEMRSDQDSQRSFYSGHSSLSWTSTIFFAKVFSDLYPASKWIPFVWLSAISLSSTTAALRVIAGKHFLTDVLVGAATGFLIGFLVPELHKKHNLRMSLITPEEGGLYVAMYYNW